MFPGEWPSKRDTWVSTISSVTFYSLENDSFAQSFESCSCSITTAAPYTLPHSLPPLHHSRLSHRKEYPSSPSLPDSLYCFTFATRTEITLYCLGIVAALISGAGFMGLTLLYGSWGNTVNSDNADATKSKALITRSYFFVIKPLSISN